MERSLKVAARGQKVRRNTSFQTDPSAVLSFRFVDATKKVFFRTIAKIGFVVQSSSLTAKLCRQYK